MSLIRIPRSIETNVLMAVLKALLGQNTIAVEQAQEAMRKVKVINILRVVVNTKKTEVTVYVNRKKVLTYTGFVALPRVATLEAHALVSSSVPHEIATSEIFNKADTILSRQGGQYWTFSGK